MTEWFRVAIYPFGYPQNPAGIPDAPLCPPCRSMVVEPGWRPGLAVVIYGASVGPNESCVKCGAANCPDPDA